MNLEKFLVIAGVPGVHKLITSRSNGLVIEDRKEGRTRFVPVRQNQMTPLGTVAVYTDTEEGTVPLADVFEKMLGQPGLIPPAPATASGQELRDYFAKVLPEHDRDRVHINDIKKCIKWFLFMQEKGIFEEIKREEEPTETETVEAKSEEKPAEMAPETTEAPADAEEETA